MTNNYAYPINPYWSTVEITAVLHFLTYVEKAYESKVLAQELLEAYKGFKQVVPAKAEEKKIDREFEVASGFSTYRAVQLAMKTGKGLISLGN